MDDKRKIEIQKKKIEILEKMIEDNSREIFYNKELLEEQQAQLMFSAKLASIGEMASSIAHEVNNPVGIIEGQLRRMEFYLDEGDINKQKELIGKMQKNIARVIKIIKGLRQLSKSTEKEDLKEINLYNFLEDFKEYNHIKTIDSNIQIDYPEVEVGLMVSGKETALAQILTNLINNSLDAVGESQKAWIKVKLEKTNGNIHLRVVDSGEGIDEKVVKKLFNPFFTTKTHEKGTGVGLNVSKKLSTEIGGDLNYDLFEGHTSFVLDLKKIA